MAVIETRRMFELARGLAEAKSRQDVPAAMALLHPEMVLESPAFGTRAVGTAENERALTRFFASFPDYAVEVDGHAGHDGTLTCWGTARMTMTGDRFGVTPSGRRAELPVFIQFEFRDGLISRERFFLDLATLCAGAGVSIDAVHRHLFGAASRPQRGSVDPRVRTVDDITTEHLFDLVVDLRPRLDVGPGPYGRRVLFGAAGGLFDGPDLRGEVLAGGGDWALVRPDGTLLLDVRLMLRTHDGALVHMTYGGRWTYPPELAADLADPAARAAIDPARYYFRTAPLFETGDERYAWLNDIVCVGSGYLVDDGIAYRVSRVR